MSLEARIAVVAVVGVVLLFFAIGSYLPANWGVETQRRFSVPPAEVLPLVKDFRSWESWAAVAGTERADTKVDVEGTAGEAGHSMRWRSNQNEAVMRMSAVPADGVDYEFLSRLGKDTDLRLRGRGSLRVVPVDGGCNVTWKDEILLDGFAERWFAWFGAQQQMQRQFQESSLAKLAVRFAPK